MNIPFRLNIFRQIEIYQDLKEFDNQFLQQLEDCSEPCKNPPTWFFEKKILHWTYEKHKHLGSPIKISYFTHGEWTYENIQKKNPIEIADDFSKKHYDIERNRKYLNYSSEEIDAVQIRKVFGNLEVRGFAKFFKESENNYWNIKQENCDGVFITPKGLEYARMIHFLYEFKNIEEEYKRIKGIERVLEIEKWQKRKFQFYIFISWFIVIGSILLFSITLYKEIISLF